MQYKFLKINRFKAQSNAVDVGAVQMSFNLDDSTVAPAAKNIDNALDKVDKSLNKVIDSQDKMSASAGNMGTHLVNVAKTALSDYRSTINQMKTLMSTSEVSPKFKIDSSTALKKLDLSGTLNQSPLQMNEGDINKILSLTNAQLKKNATEYDRQSKIIEKQIAAEDNLLNKEKEKVSFISQLTTAMEQYNSQQETADIKRQSNLETINNLLKEQSSLQTAPVQTNNSLISPSTVDNLKGAVGNYNRVMNAAQESTGLFRQHLSHSIKTVTGAAVRFRILYGVFRQITGVLGNTVNEAASYEEALNLYTVALGEYAEEATQWANRISTALYLDPKDIMQYTGALNNLVEGLGVSSDAAYKMSTNLTQLAYDMSSYLNIDVESAFAKIQSAMTGQSRAVASAGIAMQQASLQELAYSMGIRQNVADMTQAEKTYLRYIQIMRSTSNMQGDLARTIITPQNALRVIQQQFTMLARAIGQVFIPIIMAAIPYVMALTKALTRLAAALGAKLGYEVKDIDYSGLKTLNTSVGDTFKNIGTGAGKAAKATGGAAKSMKDSINDALAAFDDLNTVQTEVSSGGGGGGGVGGIGGGGVGGIGGIGGIPWDEYIDGYDMLEGLTDKFSDKVDEATENLKKLWNWIKAIAAVWATWKILKGINDLINFGQACILAYTEGKGLLGLLKLLVTNFGQAIGVAQALGQTGLGAVIRGFQIMIGPVGQAIGVLGTSVAAFILAKNAMDDWDGSIKDLIIDFTEASVAVGLLTAAGFVFAGGAGAAVVAVVGVTGAFIGLAEAIDKAQQELRRQEQYNNLFDGVGVSVRMVSEDFANGVSKIVDYGNTIEKLKTKVDNTKQNVDDAGESFAKLHNAIVSGTASGDVIENLRAATERYKNAVNANRDAHIEYNNTVLDNLKQEGTIGEETYNRLKNSAKDTYTTIALYQTDYGKKLAELDAQKQQGLLTDEAYNQKLKELKQEYAGIIDPIKNVSDGMAGLYMTAAEKIDLENPKQIKELVDSLGKSYKEGTKSIEEQKKTAAEYYSTRKYDIEQHIKKLEEELQGETKNRKEKETALNTYKTQLKDLSDTYDFQTKKFEKDSEQLSSTYKNYLATIYAQIAEAGLEGDEKIKGSVKNITSEMEKLGKFDTSKSVHDLFGNMLNTFEKDGKTFEKGTLDKFGKWGITFTGELYDKMITGHNEGYNKLTAKMGRDIDASKSTISKHYEGLSKDNMEKYTYGLLEGTISSKSKIEASTKDIGKSMNEGIIKGQKESLPNVKTSTNQIGDAAIKTFKDKLQINSPSHVFQDFGSGIVEGLNKGINDSKNSVINSINGLINSIKSKLNDTKISLKINTNVESSFNSILGKLQTFINSWRSSINKMLANTKESLNSVSVNKKGNVSYSSFGGISVPKFAQGGYPTSGDLFFANENGVPEYITSIGNRSAVINQEQMVAALSNAIVAGISKMNSNNQTGDIVVNIGNEQVYRSAIKYINRQRNVYGTNVV